MDDAASRRDPAADLRAAATELAVEAEAAVPGWVSGAVATIHRAWSGDVPPAVVAGAEAAGREAAEAVGEELRSLLATEPEEQRTTPLAVLRAAVRFPTAVLRAAGVPPVVRDAYDERHFPDDDYDLAPRSFADVDPSLHELGMRWGAAKARAHLARHGHKRTLGGS